MKQQYDSYKPSGIDWIGEIPSHWESYTLKQACYSIRYGYVGPTKDILVEAGIPYIQSLHVKNGEIQFDRGEYFVTESWGSKHPKIYTDDIVIVQTGDIGQVAIIPEEFNGCNYHALIIAKCNKNKAIPSYLCFYLRSSVGKELMLKTKTGATLPHLNSGSICFTQIILPPLAEQEAIAAWLDEKCGVIDAAIAKVDREIELIDELKQSEISRVVTRGLNPNAALRPSGIDWIGDIPEHWEIAPLKFKCSLKGRIGWNGLKSDEFKESAYAYLVTGQDFRGADIDWSKCYQIDKWRYDEDPFIQLENGDILITKDGTIGKIAKVSGLDKPACLNSGIFVMKQLGEFFSQQYLYWVLVSPQLLAFNNYVAGQGTTIQHLYQNVFENMPLLVPPLSEQHEIADYLDKKCAEIDGLKAKLKKKRDALTELRQSLISEVVTGKRKVV